MLRIPFFVLFAGLSLAAERAGAADDSYMAAMVRKAGVERLAADRYWQILLHYRPGLNGRERSLIDDPKFFLAKDGKENPEAELDATLRGFFQTESGDASPRCRFPARYAWLTDKLSLDATLLPPVTCPQLSAAIAAADPKAAFLVFPAAHMNNPASMFGHTLLRIDNSYQSELLAYAVNYAAVTDETNGFAYAVKGIFGYYKGFYSILPYYEKVKEYSDMEHRDMWEYALNLTPAETERMVLHTWELQGIYSDYYFFDENCSYNLLFLLEAARPSVQLTDRMGPWVVPADTVRAVRDAGLIARVKYRPSQAARIRRIAVTLGGDEKGAALDVAQGRRAPASLPAATARGSLDLAAELIQYRYARKELEKDAYNRLFLATLAARSAFDSRGAEDYRIDPPPSPEEGHRTGRIGLAAGVRRDKPFAEVSWRPAYHDLLDDDAGYVPGAQINFLDTALRYYPDGDFSLHRLHLIDIVSLSPRDYFFRPTSWKVAVGFDEELHRDAADHLLFRLTTGGGFTFAPGDATFVSFLGVMDANLGDRLRNKGAVGAGASTGILSTVAPFWKIHLSAEALYYPLGDEHVRLRGGCVQNFRLSLNQSLQVALEGVRSFGRGVIEVKGGWNLFF